MLISVDINRIERHIPILQQEIREAKRLEDFLAEWRMDAVTDNLVEKKIIDEQTSTIKKQITNIQDRIRWLEAVVCGFNEIKCKAADYLGSIESVFESLPFLE